MGLVYPTFTDYGTCGEMPQSLLQMVANSIVSHVDDEGHTHCYLNVLYHTAYCTDMGTECLDCDINITDLERFIINSLFALDECGRLGVKVMLNAGSAQ
jgi:hypothetical protein